ncbi:MAG: metallophosphoesterase, partial [Burkholderiaceae bacterium]
MRIAAISDIHGNALALEAVLTDARRRGFDQLVQLGDALSGPLWPRETAAILRGLDAVHVRGNHDVSLYDPTMHAPGRADDYARASIDADTLDWIRGWPRTHAIGDEVLLFHGAPHWEDHYLLEEAPHGDPRLRPPSAIAADLENHWEVVAEGLQTILRREGYPKPYEALKALTRTSGRV